MFIQMLRHLLNYGYLLLSLFQSYLLNELHIKITSAINRAFPKILSLHRKVCISRIQDYLRRKQEVKVIFVFCKNEAEF